MKSRYLAHNKKKRGISMAGEAVQIVIDSEMSWKIAAALFTFCSFLIVLLFRVVLNGLNKTITNCHTNLAEKHDNHETRITNIEKAFFKPIGGGDKG